MRKIFALLAFSLFSFPALGVVSTDSMPAFQCAFDVKNPSNKYDARWTVALAAGRYEMDLPSSHPESKKAIYKVFVKVDIKGTDAGGKPFEFSQPFLKGHYENSDSINSLPVGYYRESSSKKLKSLEINDESWYRNEEKKGTEHARWVFYRITEINGKGTIEKSSTEPDKNGNIVYVKKSYSCLDFKGVQYVSLAGVEDDVVIRGYVAEGLALGAVPKALVTDYYRSNKKWPNGNAELELEEASVITGDGVKSVKVEKNGNIVIQYDYKVSNHTIFLTPTPKGDSVNWDCKGGTLPDRYRPAACQK
jgi:type IV pilus assembly protein PilA